MLLFTFKNSLPPSNFNLPPLDTWRLLDPWSISSWAEQTIFLQSLHVCPVLHPLPILVALQQSSLFANISVPKADHSSCRGIEESNHFPQPASNVFVDVTQYMVRLQHLKGAHCWPVFDLLLTRTPRLSADLLLSLGDFTVSFYFKCRTSSLLNSMKFLMDQFLHLVKIPLEGRPLLQQSALPCNLVSPTNLLRVYSFPMSRSLMKIWSNINANIYPWGK